MTISIVIPIIASMILLGVSALISASEIAFFSLDSSLIQKLQQNNTIKSQKAIYMTGNAQRLLATIIISSNIVNISLILLLAYIIESFANFQHNPLIGFMLQAISITFCILLFGEMLPKIYATQNILKVVLFTTPMIASLEKIFSPIIQLLVNSTSLLNNKLSRHIKNEISLDELSQALELTTENDGKDTEILEGIIKFGNIQVSDIMTSRVDIVDIDIRTNFRKTLDLVICSGYSRIPVYSKTRDNIKGILYSKDLLPHLDKSTSFRWQTLIRPAYFVPATKKIDDLLNEFQSNKVHLAIVVDEYGGTSGLVSLEDIVEEIIGDISDEYDEVEQLYTKIDNHTFVFEAKILLNDFFKIDEIDENEFIGVTEDVETLAGLILELKGEMPINNEMIDYGRYVFEIISVDNRRIKKIKLHIKSNPNEYTD